MGLAPNVAHRPTKRDKRRAHDALRRAARDHLPANVASARLPPPCVPAPFAARIAAVQVVAAKEA